MYTQNYKYKFIKPEVHLNDLILYMSIVTFDLKITTLNK